MDGSLERPHIIIDEDVEDEEGLLNTANTKKLKAVLIRHEEKAALWNEFDEEEYLVRVGDSL